MFILAHYISDINPLVNLGSEAPSYVNGFVHTPWQKVMQ
jgi:glucan endo-1,3-alpha-glucosidase